MAGPLFAVGEAWYRRKAVKILLACHQSPHVYPIPAYGFWRTYFVEGLKEAGHEVIEVRDVDWARGLLALTPAERAQWRDETWSRTLETVRQTAGLDLFLGYLYPGQIEVPAVRAIQSVGIPAVNFFCDNLREFRRLPSEFAPFSLHWVPETRARDLYRVRGWAHVYAPMPAWVPPGFRTPPEVERLPPTFLGSHDLLREILLADAVAAGLPSLEIRGSGWQDSKTSEATAPPAFGRAGPLTRIARQFGLIRRDGCLAPLRKFAYHRASRRPRASLAPYVRPRPAANDEFLRMLRECEVALGINRYPSFRHSPERPDVYSRLRDLEAPMAGACYLTEWTHDLPCLFDLETEIVTYRTADELAAQLRELLRSPQRRRELRARGQARALRDHTVGLSVARIAHALGIA